MRFCTPRICRALISQDVLKQPDGHTAVWKPCDDGTTYPLRARKPRFPHRQKTVIAPDTKPVIETVAECPQQRSRRHVGADILKTGNGHVGLGWTVRHIDPDTNGEKRFAA